MALLWWRPGGGAHAAALPLRADTIATKSGALVLERRLPMARDSGSFVAGAGPPPALREPRPAAAGPGRANLHTDMLRSRLSLSMENNRRG